jgi:hypothetical protein
MRIPPDVLDNPFHALTAFYIPKSFLDKKLQVFLVVKDETKATAHAMPDEVCGHTELLEEALRKNLL